MSFVSVLFFLFLSCTFLLFVCLPTRFRMGLLLFASYLFYATWNVPFIFLILLTTSIDYWISHKIANSNSAIYKKSALLFGLSVNLAILFFYKYFNFFLRESMGVAHFFHWPVIALPYLDVILPLGISFYTFEAISYMVDVYRGNKPAPNWLSYNFYIMYFPHLISGPIVRFGELWPQYAKSLTLPSTERLKQGLELLILGFLFKMYLANPMAGMADTTFSDYLKVSSLEAWRGALAFTVQIYFDFMGYTHMARGASLLFNIELPLNFNHPYSASNIANGKEKVSHCGKHILSHLNFVVKKSKKRCRKPVLNPSGF